MKLQVKKGTTSKLLDIFVSDSSSTTGAGLTGLVYNSPGLTAYYYREGAASATVITPLVTMVLGTWATGGFVVIDGTNMPGCYQLGIPDAAIATGANSVIIMLKGATNMAPLVLEIELTATDNQDAVRAGMTSLPSSGTLAVNPTLAAVTHTGAVIPTVTTLTGHTAQTGDNYARLGTPAGASISADVAAIKVDTGNNYAIVNHASYGNAQLVRSTTPANTLDISVTGEAGLDFNNIKQAGLATTLTNYTIPLVTDVTIKTGYALTVAEEDSIVNKTWDALRASHVVAGSFGQGVASVQGNITGSVASVTADVGITQVGADKVWGTVNRTLTSFGTLATDIWTNSTRTLTAFSTSLALSVWDVLESAIITAASIGLKVKNNLDAAITSRQASGNVTVGGYAAGQDPATLMLTIPANKLTTNVSGYVTVITNNDKIGYSLAVDQAVNATKINGSAMAATQLALSAVTIVNGAAIAGTLSTTQMTTNLTIATNDHYNGRIIIWTSGALQNQATNITAYDGATKKLTFTAITSAPLAGDTFIIL